MAQSEMAQCPQQRLKVILVPARLAPARERAHDRRIVQGLRRIDRRRRGAMALQELVQMRVQLIGHRVVGVIGMRRQLPVEVPELGLAFFQAQRGRGRIQTQGQCLGARGRGLEGVQQHAALTVPDLKNAWLQGKAVAMGQRQHVRQADSTIT